MADLITKADAEAKYLENSSICPLCGGEIVCDQMTGDGNCQHSETHCEDCGAKFVETYRLEIVELIKGPTSSVKDAKELVA